MPVQWLEDLTEADARSIGKKAAALGQLSDLGFEVPRGFVVTAQTFESFVRQNNLEQEIESILASVDRSDIHALRDASDRIQNMILSAHISEMVRDDIEEAYENINMSQEVRNAGGSAVDFIGGQRETEFVAVRSSPTGTRIPGAHRSQLNVNGKQSVVDAVKSCWASLYSVEALAVEDAVGDIHSMAVIVQRMVEADISGALFDRPPVRSRQDDSTYVVESLYGLGTALSDGNAIPDRFHLWTDGTISDRSIATKDWKVERDPTSGKTIKHRVSSTERETASLSDSQLRQLADTLSSLVEQVGRNVVLDFAVGRNKIYVLDYDRFWRSEHSGSSDTEPFLAGTGAAAGDASGPARIIYNDTEIGTGYGDEILVSVDASARLIPALATVNGIITDNGGLSSNLSSLARALNTPCIVGTHNASDMLTRDEQISMDGANGTIYDTVQSTTQDYGMPTGDRSGQAMSNDDLLTATTIKVLGAGSGETVSAEGAIIPEYTDQSVIRAHADAHRPHTVWTRTQQPFDQANIRQLTGPNDTDITGKGLILSTYGTVMRSRHFTDRGVGLLGLDVNALIQDGDREALMTAIEQVASVEGACERAVLMHEVDPECIQHAVTHGIDTIAVPAGQLSHARNAVAKAERRFIMEKLRQL